MSKASISGLTPIPVIRLAHGLQHARRVDHDVIGLGEIHRAAVERADLGPAQAHMLDPLGGADHVGAGLGKRQRRVGRAEHQVAAHPRRQVQHHVHIRGTDALGHLAVEGHIARRRAALGVAHMAMDHRRAGLRGVDGAGSNLSGRARHMRAAVLGAARAGDGGGDEDLAIHGERHGILPVLWLARLSGGLPDHVLRFTQIY